MKVTTTLSEGRKESPFGKDDGINTNTLQN